MYQEDSASFNGQIGAGTALSSASGYLEVSTERADNVYVWIDDGTTGSAAGTYDLQMDAMKKATHFSDDWMRDYQATGSTAFKHQASATSSTFRIDLTNASGSSGNYRIFVASYVDES